MYFILYPFSGKVVEQVLEREQVLVVDIPVSHNEDQLVVLVESVDKRFVRTNQLVEEAVEEAEVVPVPPLPPKRKIELMPSRACTGACLD
jgi:hypothetical protein